MSYQPTEEILDKYADVLINFALNNGDGVKSGEVVLLQIPECAKPMLIALRRAVLKAGAFPLVNYRPDDMSREYYELASEEQLQFFPEVYLKGRIDQIDHFVSIIASTNKYELEGIEPKKIMLHNNSFKLYKDWVRDKENAGRLTWTAALYGTDAMASEVSLTTEEYWEQIIHACYLDCDNPRLEWKRIFSENERITKKLNTLKIKNLHITADRTDLVIKIGSNRKWLSGGGRNIPSFEIFTSPDWRGTNGYISFNQPLYRYGSVIKDIYLEFKDGIVTTVTASHGQDVLQEMINIENANKLGEFSLTDSRQSRISKFMGETLYDENVGGTYGNTHIALGASFKDAFNGELTSITESMWDEMGYNDSVIHTDIIDTSDRVVIAHLENGGEKVIYSEGKFQI